MHCVPIQLNVQVPAISTLHNGEGWIKDFIIPEPTSFSTPTMKFLLGKETDRYLLTKAVRIEVVAVLTNLIMMHTRFPTSDEYNTVCRNLIEKYPRLQDTIGNGYVSCQYINCI